MLQELRAELEQVRELVRHGDQDGALDALEQALHRLDGQRLLTTTEAASFLGIRSVNTLKLLLKAEGLQTVQRGNRTMIPVTELERIQQSERVLGIRASDRLHDLTAGFGSEGLSEAECESLEAGRPGSVPWQQERSTDLP